MDTLPLPSTYEGDLDPVTSLHCCECPFIDHCLVAITVLKTIQARPRKGAVNSSLENTPLSIIFEIKIIQWFKNTTYSILVKHVEIFSHLCIFVHWPLVTGIIECSRIYVLTNLLGMLRNSFVALS